MNPENIVNQYISFQGTCHSPFHVVATLKGRLEALGFQKLQLKDSWQIKAGGKYFATDREEKSIISFRVGTSAPAESGFAIIAAHTDSPVLRLKLNPWGQSEGYQVLYPEIHGGIISRSWLDRPLILAGRIYSLKRKGGKPQMDANGTPILQAKLVATKWPLAVIPDTAIHLDREKNEIGAINPETMLHALMGCRNPKSGRELMGEALGERSFDGFELNLAPYWPHCKVGASQEFILGPRHDDLGMVFPAQCAMEAESKGKAKHRTCVAAFFDAEETGSQTSSGAASYFGIDVLQRIHNAHPETTVQHSLGQTYTQSFLLSADMAHGVHPALKDKHDATHRPVMNAGVVVKENANDRYATSGRSATVFRALAESCDVPVQEYVIRQDLQCGSTIGPILAARLGCQTADIGIPMLAMHSTAETLGGADLFYAYKVFVKFFNL